MEVNFGDSLKELMIGVNVTPEALAKVSLSTVYAWMNSQTDIRLS